MGVSARVASLQAQLAAKESENRELRRELDLVRAATELVDPILTAAVDFVLAEEGPEIGDALSRLRKAVHAARDAVEAAGQDVQAAEAATVAPETVAEVLA